MSEGTRAPWARVAPPSQSGPAPGAGASVTRAPWATGGGVSEMPMSRAPWAQGVSVPGSAPVDRLDFEGVALQQPEYCASLKQQQPQTFSSPSKIIRTPNYLPLWKRTSAYAELTGFILLLNEKVRGVRVKPEGAPSKKYSISPKVQLVIDWLRESQAAIAQIPPIQQSMRYGNKAFRTWHEQRTAVEAVQPMLHALLGPELVSRGAATELLAYLQDSFGSLQRIDYGTGHELNFVMWLCAVNQLGVFTSDDHVALVLEVFRHYILLMEALQSTYWLEPAGSEEEDTHTRAACN